MLKIKRFFFVLVLLSAIGGLQFAEANSATLIKLKVGAQKKISGTNVTLKFVSVIEDSRCPEDANCVWAGSAKVRIQLKKAGGAWQSFELNSNAKPERVVFAGYEIKLSDLDPKMRSNIRIDRNGYTAQFTLHKVDKK